MNQPLLVRPLTDDETLQLRRGLRSADAFTLRRSQVLLASVRGAHARAIGQQYGCSDQAVRNVIKAFNQRGLAALHKRSSRPHRIEVAFDTAACQRLRDLLHRSPRDFGRPTSVWTLPLVAEVSQAEGLTAGPVTGETVRATLARLGVRWQRAKDWIRSPDPAYDRKKDGVTA
jgi:transposase